MTAEEQIWLRLHMTPGLGRRALIRLMDRYGSSEAALNAGPEAWIAEAAIRPDAARAFPVENDPKVQKTLDAMDKMRVRVIPLMHPSLYPPLLKSIHDPPALLYVRGQLPQAEALAVVGARRASLEGRETTTGICSDLAREGITIVSGLARGIDTAAHLGALDGGTTVGVLGCGIDRVYPPENTRLVQQVLEKGAVISEYPPGTPPLPGHFPGRNRIISGLSRGVLVVEAAENSGSLITADFALEQGREVFPVPGPVRSSVSRGANQLLKDGAHVVTESRDILDVLWPGLTSGKRGAIAGAAFASWLSKDALRVYELLSREPLISDEIVRKSGLTPMEVSDILLHLELQGGVEKLSGMRFVRVFAP